MARGVQRPHSLDQATSSTSVGSRGERRSDRGDVEGRESDRNVIDARDNSMGHDGNDVWAQLSRTAKGVRETSKSSSKRQRRSSPHANTTKNDENEDDIHVEEDAQNGANDDPWNQLRQAASGKVTTSAVHRAKRLQASQNGAIRSKDVIRSRVDPMIRECRVLLREQVGKHTLT